MFIEIIVFDDFSLFLKLLGNESRGVGLDFKNRYAFRINLNYKMALQP